MLKLFSQGSMGSVQHHSRCRFQEHPVCITYLIGMKQEDAPAAVQPYFALRAGDQSV